MYCETPSILMGPRSWVIDLSRFLGFVFLATKQMRREYVAHLKSTLKRLVLLGCFFAKKKNQSFPVYFTNTGGKKFCIVLFFKGDWLSCFENSYSWAQFYFFTPCFSTEVQRFCILLTVYALKIILRGILLLDGKKMKNENSLLGVNLYFPF